MEEQPHDRSLVSKTSLTECDYVMRIFCVCSVLLLA